MSGFFSDNQAKQKAFDRYYNAMARSDYVQGRKLRSLIERDAANDAQTDSLANLFQNAMYKAREYDYDVITQKLMKKAPPVVKNIKSSSKKGPVVNLGPKQKGRFGKSATSAPVDPDEEMKQAAPITPSPKKVLKVKTATPPRKRSPVKIFESDEEMKSSVPSTPPRRKSDPPFPSSSFQTPPRRRSSSRADDGFSIMPNVLSPQSMARHKARVAMEDDMASLPPTPPSKFFPDLFGTTAATKRDEATAAAKIEERGDIDKLRDLADKLSKQRAATKFAKGKKSAKVSSDPIPKEKIMKQIGNSLNVSKFGYLTKKEKVATANEMYEIVNDLIDNAMEKVERDKRKRTTTPPDKSPSDKRGMKMYREGPQSPRRNLYADLADASDSDSDSFNGEIEEELQERERNKKRNEEARLLINSINTPVALHKQLKAQFGREISEKIAKIEGKSGVPKNEPLMYFNIMFPKPNRERNISIYKERVQGLLNGIYLYE